MGCSFFKGSAFENKENNFDGTLKSCMHSMMYQLSLFTNVYFMCCCNFSLSFYIRTRKHFGCEFRPSCPPQLLSICPGQKASER